MNVRAVTRDKSVHEGLGSVLPYQGSPSRVEPLRVKVQPPNTRYWNLTLESRWHEIGDYLHRPTSLTLEQVEYGEDGSVEFIVAHRDPGTTNWLDTSGHNFGFMTLRWLDAKGEKVPLPELEVVKWQDLNGG